MQNTQKRDVPASDQLQNADLLACRQVCKSWKQCLDKYLQGQVSSQGNLDFWNGGSTSVATKISNRRLDKFAELMNVISLAPLENIHPFPSRQLRIEVHPVYSVESSQYFQTGMNSFLDRFGHEVSYLSFVSYQETSWFFVRVHALSLNWFTLRSWLLKMPNLRGVNFQFSPTVEFKTEDVEQKEKLILAGEPFPPLPKLEFIECHFVPSDIVDCMLTNNPQVKKLTVYETYNKKVLPWPWSGLQLNFLENLSHFSVNIYEMTQLNALRLADFPLRNLQLSSIGPMAEKWNLDKVFGILRNFGNTLKQVCLKLRISIPDKDLKLALPNLEELDLCFQQNSADQISYDFILPLNSLQCLNVNFNWEIEANGSLNGNGVTHENGNADGDEIDEKVEVIQLKSYQNRLYSSNIWHLASLGRHRKRCHPDPSSRGNRPAYYKELKLKDPKIIPCQFCGRLFNSEESLRRHMKTVCKSAPTEFQNTVYSPPMLHMESKASSSSKSFKSSQGDSGFNETKPIVVPGNDLSVGYYNEDNDNDGNNTNMVPDYDPLM